MILCSVCVQKNDTLVPAVGGAGHNQKIVNNGRLGYGAKQSFYLGIGYGRPSR